MWILVLMTLLLAVTPSFAEQSFDEKYERDYNIFNPGSAEFIVLSAGQRNTSHG